MAAIAGMAAIDENAVTPAAEILENPDSSQKTQSVFEYVRECISSFGARIASVFVSFFKQSILAFSFSAKRSSNT